MTITDFIEKYIQTVAPYEMGVGVSEDITDEMLADLQEVDIFKNTKLRRVSNDERQKSQTFILKEGMELSGEIAIISLVLSYIKYEPNANPGPMGIFISNTLNDPQDFTSYRKLTMGIPTDTTEDEVRKILHKRLDEALDNPSKYQYPSYRHLLIRAVFGPKILEDENEYLKIQINN